MKPKHLWVLVSSLFLLGVLSRSDMLNTWLTDDSVGQHTSTIKRDRSNQMSEFEGVQVVRHSIINAEESISSIKKQITVEVAIENISTKTTKDDLSLLLFALYEKYRDYKLSDGSRPSHIGIYVYQTAQHAASGMGQWMAMLERAGYDRKPEIYYDENNISAVSAPSSVKHGLTENQRKSIFKEIVLAEDKAAAQGQDFEIARSSIMEKYGLSKDQLLDILVESSQKNWPLP